MISEEEFNNAIVAVLRKGRNTSVEPDNWFHCSGAGSCRRQIWNGKHGKTEFSDKAIRSMGVGTILHSWLERTMDFAGATKESTVAKEYGDIYMIGRVDLYDKDTVYDYKTVRALWYLPKIGNGYGKNAIYTYYSHHLPQLNMYADILGKENICFVYVDKGDVQVKTFVQKADPKIVADVIQKFKDVYKKLDLKENPFPLCDCFACQEEQKMSTAQEEWKKSWKVVPTDV
jgi:hypothetical protein